MRLSDVNVALFSHIQQMAQQQQSLRCVIKGNEIEVTGSMVRIAEFREELQKSLALKSSPRDLSGAQGVSSSLAEFEIQYHFPPFKHPLCSSV